MHLTLQLITSAADSQKLLRDLLTVFQMFHYCQLPIFPFLILLTGSVVQYIPSKNHILFRKNLIHKDGYLLTKKLFNILAMTGKIFVGRLLFLEPQ